MRRCGLGRATVDATGKLWEGAYSKSGHRLLALRCEANDAGMDKRRCGAHSRHGTHWRSIVLYTIAVVLLILWVLGLATSYTVGGFLHILLVVAVIMVVYQLISGRRVG